MNKNVYRENYDLFISSLYNKQELHQKHTSGSTGTPFTTYQDGCKRIHSNAENLYYNGLTGFKVGRKIIYLRSLTGDYNKSRITQFAQNIEMLACANQSDEGIEDKLEYIRKRTLNEGAMLIAYATTLELFKNYFEKNGYDKAKGCKLFGVVSTSTMLYDDTRKAIEKAFGCKCVSRYANEENGFLGQDAEEPNVFIMNESNYYFEILKFDSDEPAEAGEIGRIVVTDLYNYGMPMIRYENGDVGAWVYTIHNGKRVKAIGAFGGRIVDLVYDVDGNAISPHDISNLMKKYQNVLQYQFIQKSDNTYHLKINAGGVCLDEAKLTSDVRDIFGADAKVTFEYCDDIPVLSSGKRRYVINESKK